MTTDEERREVARRLRECRGGWSSGECYYTIINTLGLPDTSREDGGAALYARLADLIEPCENVKCVAEIKIEGEQLEEIVRCRDCVYTGTQTVYAPNEKSRNELKCCGPNRFVGKNAPFVEPDGFCAWGRRRS